MTGDFVFLSLSEDIIPPYLEDAVLGSFFPLVCLICYTRTSLILQKSESSSKIEEERKEEEKGMIV